MLLAADRIDIFGARAGRASIYGIRSGVGVFCGIDPWVVDLIESGCRCEVARLGGVSLGGRDKESGTV